jgi:dTDP-4-amino-4,6-dideoxygalactose transaminase
MAVSFYNFQDLHDKNFREEYLARVSEILEKNSFIEGPWNAEFEKEFAALQKAKHCLLLANGTDALEIALKVLGVGHDKKVAVPGITFYATAEAVLKVGATPIFVDVNPATGLICPESLRTATREHDIAAVMPVHIYGLPAPMEEIDNLCRGKGIHVIEDAAQAQGTFLPSGPVGSGKNLATFSFYPTKNLGGAGDAGGILTNDDDLARKIRVERNHGRGDETSMGRNSRCDHLQAAFLHLKLKDIQAQNIKRKQAAANYHKALAGLPVQTLPGSFIETSSWHLYPIQLDSAATRAALQETLKNKGIGTSPFYEKALSQEPSLARYPAYDKGAKERAGKTLCLPIHPFLTQGQIDEVATAIRDHFQKV